MQRARTLSTMAAALLVGAAFVLLWPAPDPGPALHGLPEPEVAPPPTVPGDAAARTSPPPQAPPDSARLRSHLDSAGATWRALASQAEHAKDEPTRALAPHLAAVAALAPEGDAHPALQPTVALLRAELALEAAIEASSLDAEDLFEELGAVRSEWIGAPPMAGPQDPR